MTITEQALTIAKRFGMGRVGFAVLGATAATQLHAELTAAARAEAEASYGAQVAELTAQLERTTARVLELQHDLELERRRRTSPVDPGAVARLQSEHVDDLAAAERLPVVDDEGTAVSVSLSAVSNA